MFIHKLGLSFFDKMCYNPKMNSEILYVFDTITLFQVSVRLEVIFYG